ncbi:MAG: transporter [Eubacteriales bacterium]|nr:transporter [Eubacteriales bacterium]
MTVQKIKKYCLLYIALLIYSASTICAKFAASQSMLIKIVVFFGLEFICLGVYAIFWQQVLKHFSLVTAMASKGVVVIFNLIWSVILFGETISLANILGAAIIIFGIWMVSSDD